MKSIFISSTFKDMQAERDYLHEKIFSRLRRLAGRYGEDVQELDLRWGVDTYLMDEAESGYQVLRVCIDAIDRCKPYIVVLLGERYGWIPDEQLVESLRDERLKQHYEAAMSITNLEIQYGALSEEETLERCIFCFRNPDFIEQVPEELRSIYLSESPEHKEKLKKLKEQIRSRKNVKLLDYQVKWDESSRSVTGLEGWGEKLYQLLQELLQKELAGKEASHPVERYILDAQCTKERYLASYTPRLYEETQAVNGFWFMAGDKSELYHKNKSAEELYAYGREQCMHFSGEAGCGKSALLAALSREVEEAGASQILYFSGNPGCQNPGALKSVLIYRLEEILGLPHIFGPENQSQYLRTLDEKAKKIPVYCFVDALDQLFPDYDKAYLEILDLCPNLFVITSALKEFPYEKALLRARKIRFIEVQSFSNVDKRNLIQKAGAYRGKKIDHFLEERICEKEGTGNPLFLSLLLQRLFAMRREEFEEAERLAPGMDGLHQYMLRLIEEEPGNAREEALLLFERVSSLFDSSFFKLVTALIAMSETGLTERELGRMLEGLKVEFSQLKFQEILYYLYDVFTEKEDGRFIFLHRIFYEAAGEGMEQRTELRRCFIDYSRTDPEFMEREGYRHILKSRDELGKRVLADCSTWTSALEVRELAVKMLSEDDKAEAYFRDMLSGENVEKLFRFWRAAIGTGADKKARVFRQSISERIAEDDSLEAELRAEAFEGLWNWGEEEEKQLFYTKQVDMLILKMRDPDKQLSWTIRKGHMEAWNLLDGGRYREAAEHLKEIIKKVESLLSHPKLGKDMAFNSIFFSKLLLSNSRKYLKVYLPSYLEEALGIYQRFPEYGREKKFRLQEVELYLEGDLQYIETEPERGKEYAGKALKLARKLCEDYQEEEAFKLLYRALNFYGNDVDRKNCYKYRYEALDVCKRAYQLTHSDYWQHMAAVQASFFARDISSMVQEVQIDTRDEWFSRERQAWDLSFAYFEELSGKGYPYVDRKYYIGSLIKRSEEEAFKFVSDKAAEYAKKACSCLKEDEKKGKDIHIGKAASQYLQACALAAENLDDMLCAEEALPYMYELQECAEEQYKEEPSSENLYILLRCLRIAARGLYHGTRDEDALKAVREGFSLLEMYEGGTDQELLSIREEFTYIHARISLKREEISQARKYMELLTEQMKKGEKDPWMAGQLLLLAGDVLSAEKNYMEARKMYRMAEDYWREQKTGVEENLRWLVGFEIKDGVIKRGLDKRKWHVKTFFYQIYAAWQRAGIPGADMTHSCQGYITVFHFCMAKLYDLKRDHYLPVAEEYMFRAVNKLLSLEKDAGWKDEEVFDIFRRAVSYCEDKDMDAEWILEPAADAFAHYDLGSMMDGRFILLWQSDFWTCVLLYLKERPDLEKAVLPCNRLGIGTLWFRLGCYEEACVWLERARGEEPCYEEAGLRLLFAKAMILLFREDMEQLEEIKARLTQIYEEREYAFGSSYLERLYWEIMKKPEEAFIMYERLRISIKGQEEAQRSLHILKMIAEQGSYYAMSERQRKYFFRRLKEVWQAYMEGSKEHPGGNDRIAFWKKQAEDMKRLAKGGMIWQTDKEDAAEYIFTVCRKISETARSREEREEVYKWSWDFWQENYPDIPAENLSMENLYMLQRLENRFGAVLLPKVEGELCRRTGDKIILLRALETGKESRDRTLAFMDIFEGLLEEELEKWGEDFRSWIVKDDHIWAAKDMKFFKEINKIQDDPKKAVLYEVYRQYQITFKENWHKHWMECLEECKEK